MMYYRSNLRGLGLGDAGIDACLATCDPSTENCAAKCAQAGTDNQAFDPAAACVAGGGSAQSCCTANPHSPVCSGVATTTGNQSSSGTPFWQTAATGGISALPAILTAFGLGPKPTIAVVKTPTPWYSSPLGIGALVVAGVVGYKLFMKD